MLRLFYPYGEFMGTQDLRFTSYRGFDISTNPTGTVAGSLTDAFLIFEPSTNPMYTALRYEFPRKECKTYHTEHEAQHAAIETAHDWVDSWLNASVAGRKEKV
jgi:hypothetical protein